MRVTPTHVLAALSLFALLLPSSSTAQTSLTTTGSVVGTVRDGTGGVLPNAIVELSSGALMGARRTATQENGRYRFTALPPGEYRLTFSLSGFRTFEQEAVRVSLGFTATVDAVLEPATQPEHVTVRGDISVLDRHSAASGETFDAAALADLPTSRSMFALLAATPAIEVARIEVGGASGAAGGSYGAYGTRGANRPTVEGINVTSIFATGFTLDYGAFEEVSVLTGAHGPEWATPGVHMQFVSKSGGNQYRGTFYADYENRRWQSFNVDDGQIDRGAQSGGGLSPRDANRLWHYHDVNADVGGFVTRDRLWWYASLREQEIAARLVNFPVAPHRTRLGNYTGKTTFKLSPRHTLVAFAQAGRNHQPHRLDPFAPSGGGLNAATAFNESVDSTADQLALGWVWKADWMAIPNDRLLLEARTGQFGSDQGWTPNGTGPRFEDIGTQRVAGGNRDSERSLRRNQLFGAVTYFGEGGIGSHHLKLGAELLRTLDVDTWNAAYPGGMLHVLRNCQPLEIYLFDTPSRSESGLWSYAAYASDAWRFGDRLTVNLGARMDRYRVFLPAQRHPAGAAAGRVFPAVHNLIDWTVVVPRLAAAYNPASDGKTLLKVSYGRYRLAPGTMLGFNSNPNASEWWARYAWPADPNGNGRWDPGEEGALLGKRGGAAIESIDPRLTLPVLNEVAAWLEREVPAGVAVRTGVVRRTEHDHFTRQNASQPYEAFTVPVLLHDPGPDGVPGTPDDGRELQVRDLDPAFRGLPPMHIVRNVPHSSSEYWSWEVGAARRVRGRWSLVAGFVHTWHRDQAAGYAGQTVRNNPYPLTPNDLIATDPEGRHVFRTWTAKAYGTYVAPAGIRLTSLLRHQSGQPFGRTFATGALSYGGLRVLIEPVGTRRMDNVTLVDVRLEKAVRLPRSRRLSAFLDVFNVFNANPVQNAIWSSGPSFLRPVTIVPPRIARIGVKADW